MRVYTYFHPVPQIDFLEECKLHALWKRSWMDSEFIPMTLTHQTAEMHPKFAEFDRKVRSFPSINPPGYDIACWHRWLALAVSGGGLMVDYDMICRAFSEEMLQFPNPVTILDRGGVPCAVYATELGAEQIVNDILTFEHKHDGKHYSDMFFFQARGYPREENLTLPFGHPDWQMAPAVHFSHSDTARERPNKFRSVVVWHEMFKPFLAERADKAEAGLLDPTKDVPVVPIAA